MSDIQLSIGDVPSKYVAMKPARTIVDEERQPASKYVGSAYHTIQTANGRENMEGYNYPTRFMSLYNRIILDSEWWEVAANGATEFVGSFIFFLVVALATNFVRNGLTLPILSYATYPLVVPVAAGVAYAFIHASMSIFSVTLFPTVAIMEFFAPSTWKRYGPRYSTGEGQRWLVALAMLFVQLVCQFVGTLGGIGVAFEATPAGMPLYLQAATPVIVNTSATMAGVLLGIGSFVAFYGYYAMTMEGYRSPTTQTSSLYAGIAVFLGYLISYDSANAIFSMWQPVSSMILIKSSHNYNSDVTCGGGAVCFSKGTYWAVVLVPAIISVIISFGYWFVITRRTDAAEVAKSKPF